MLRFVFDIKEIARVNAFLFDNFYILNKNKVNPRKIRKKNQMKQRNQPSIFKREGIN